MIDFAYAPVIEPPHPTAFLSENPYTLINASKIKHIPWMISVAENEGAIFAFGKKIYNTLQVVGKHPLKRNN